MRGSRFVVRHAWVLGLISLGTGIFACDGATTDGGDQADATTEASGGDEAPSASDDGSKSMADATMDGPPPESGTISDAPYEASLDSTSPDAQPILDAAPDVLLDADAGPGLQPDAEAGPDAQPVVEAGSDAAPLDAESDANADANTQDAGDGGDGDAETTYSIIAGLLGSACLACASDPVNSGCVGDGIDCESVTGTATAGAAIGESRAQLCLDTLTCVLQSGCMIVGADASDPGNGLACYCGDVSYTTCMTSPGQGACRSIEEEGLESTDVSTVVQRYPNDTPYGAGMANSIALCMAQVCQSSCFP
jgi:hypothetical protein